ncbi:MAG: NADH-quinone oxidoreductase subunit D [Chloroflexi bacterium]|nr:NADH-quinone oxidoreductase subunit D [Chloroflexota bacterium]MCI0805724.1 NADH-quinone oxidoreductase subunit D [Chloroflexota bacterium]
MTDKESPQVEGATREPDSLEQHFPGILTPDEREGFDGYLVAPDKLTEFATRLRDEFGYDYLSSVTGVDYLPDEVMEVVYHAYRIEGGPALVFKTQVPRADPVVPSLVGVWPGADFQEREAWDLLGIRFTGHPNLRRILMWEGFEGHPLRKDWHEAYFEEDAKPFANRWPEGDVYRIEDKIPFGKNVQYPSEFTPEGWIPEGDEGLYAGLGQISNDGDGSSLKTDQLVVNLGPQHPSTHGVFRMVVTLDGETVTDLKPVMGYLHRNHEKIGERNTYIMNMPYTDRLDYLSSMSNNFGYALAVEKLMDIQPPERAEYIRVIMAELTRIVSHLWAIGFLLNDLGAFFTPALYAINERELILDVFEAVSGSRMMCNYFRFGGLARDLPPGTLQTIRELIFERLPRRVDELDIYLTENEIVRSRCIGVGVLSPEKAVAFSAAGPVLRASGIPYDVRRAEPYGIYDRFDFEVAVRYGGDVYDRYLVRLQEIRESIRIVQQAVDDIPEGEIQTGKPIFQVRVPAGEAYGRVENPKGELGFYVVSNGKPNPWRYHIRAPSFINLTALAEMCKGHKVADVVAILGSIDIILGEVDR